MDLSEYRASPNERLRTEDLLRLIPGCGGRVLDVGAREGHFSRLLAARFDRVIALDLEKPDIDHPNVDCVMGDATQLQFERGHFDLVFCAEVLEHIPPDLMPRACAEMERVSRRYLLIGVPYRQDLRHGRTLCPHCSFRNPPWGHVNTFDEASLMALFPSSSSRHVSFVGTGAEGTNSLAAWLDELAGHPYGTYEQEEPCVKCGGQIRASRHSLLRKVPAKLSMWAHSTTARSSKRPNWIHVLFERIS